jgi:hypothetical protein
MSSQNWILLDNLLGIGWKSICHEAHHPARRSHPFGPFSFLKFPPIFADILSSQFYNQFTKSKTTGARDVFKITQCLPTISIHVCPIGLNISPDAAGNIS